MLNVQVRLASPQYPQSNGQVERVNRVVIQVIKTSLEESLEKWVTYLPQIEFAINNSPHTTTKESPHYLNYFRHPITPVIVNDPVLSTPLKTMLAAPERAELHQRVVGKLRRAALRMHGLLACRRRPHDLQEGDYMLWDCSSHTTTTGQRKSKARWEGPYRIRERKGLDAFVLEGLPSGIPATQNVSKLYPFFYSPDKFKDRLVPGPP